MTQVLFATGENSPTIHTKLNQAVQGYRFLRRSTFIGTSGPTFYNCHARAAAVSARLVGPGGGGAGAAGGGPTDCAAGSGGGGGGYYEFFSTDSTILRNTFIILAPRGAIGGSAGSPGTTQTSGAAINFRGPLGTFELAFAGPGRGGFTMPPGTSPVFLDGGVGGTVFNTFATAHDLFMFGEPGGIGFRFGANMALSGRGGNTIFRGAGGESGPGAGRSAASFGGGGSGGAANGSVGQAGGTGGDACVIFDEYY